MWAQGRTCSSCCTFSGSGQATANARMYCRLRGENPAGVTGVYRTGDGKELGTYAIFKVG